MKQTVDVSRETQGRLNQFSALLGHWNAKINLINRSDETDIDFRHIQDSLQLAPLIPPSATRALDLGSGAGFPGIVLAIATGVHFTLVEADVRKCAFLREAARLTDSPITVIPARIEEVNLPRFPLITARALAPLRRLLEFCSPFIEEQGTLLFLKGATVDAEIAEAENDWHMKIERHKSLTGTGFVLRITEANRA